jgi:hypothetical protein
MRVFRLRPSAGHVGVVLASLALFVSLGGVSAAASAINGTLLKKGTVTGTQIKNSSLTGAKIKNKSLGSADLARNSVRGSNADSSGAVVLNFGAVGVRQCAFKQVNGAKSASGDVSNDAVLISPSADFDPNAHFSIYANPNGSQNFTITICNVGGSTAEDPDGPGGTTYRAIGL